MVSDETKSLVIQMGILISVMFLGIPFLVYSLSFPALLFIVGFVRTDEWAINLSYVWVWAMVGMGAYLEVRFVMKTRARFLERHKVSSISEFFKINYNKKARKERKKRQAVQDAKTDAYKNKSDQIHKNMTKDRDEEATINLESKAKGGETKPRARFG